MLQNVVVLYRRTITFSNILSTNQSRLHIPAEECDERGARGGGAQVCHQHEGAPPGLVGDALPVEAPRVGVYAAHLARPEAVERHAPRRARRVCRRRYVNMVAVLVVGVGCIQAPS